MRGQLFHRIEPLPDMTIAVSTTQRVRLETLKNIHAVHLNCVGAGPAAATYAEMVADIARVQLKIGGQVVVNATPAQLWMRYHYYNDSKTVVTPAGDLPIWFTPFELPWNGQAKYWRLGMKANGDPQSTMANQVVVEVTYTAGALTITSVKPWIEVDDDDPEILGDHIRYVPFNTGTTATGRQDIDNLDRANPIIGARAYFFPLAVGTIDDWTILENSTYIHLATPVPVHRHQQQAAGRVPQNGFAAAHECIDFTLGNDPTAFEPIISLTRWIVSPNWSVAPGASYDIMQELLCRNL